MEHTVKQSLPANRRQITITIDEALLKRLDKLSREMSQSRSALIAMAVYQAVNHGFHIGREA